MGVELKISWSDVNQLEQALKDFIKRGGDLRPAYSVIGENLLLSIEKNFKAEGRPEKWAPHSPETLKAYLRKKTQRKTFQILTRKGRLRRSITY